MAGPAWAGAYVGSIFTAASNAATASEIQGTTRTTVWERPPFRNGVVDGNCRTCSDERYHNLGGMPRLFWHAIEEARSHGLRDLDLGRSDWDQERLVRFRDHLGATKTTHQYWQI